MTPKLADSTEFENAVGHSEWVDPDLEFIEALRRRAGESFVKCFQCGTCTGTCDLSPDAEPFPRKEMIWAAWGLKERLLHNPDVWLCHHCQDCSVNCPRGARPAEVLAAVRMECVQRYAFPRFLGRWANQPSCLPLMLGIPAALLTLALTYREKIGHFLGYEVAFDDQISYAYSNAFFPHWLINSVFLTLTVLVLLVTLVGVMRFARVTRYPESLRLPSERHIGLGKATLNVIRDVLTHDRFNQCTRAKTRSWSHFAVMFGFVGLTVVTLWVITSRINPLLGDGFVYPLNFWSPWKLLANAAGAAVLGGSLWMIWERLRDPDEPNGGSYFDWAFLSLIVLVVGTGFFTEVLHFVRLEPHRHLVYFAHLVFVGALILYLPYSKFAHFIYRLVALIHAERVGREAVVPGKNVAPQPVELKEQ